MTAPTLREEHVALTRERIMQGLERLLIDGRDVTFAGLAVSSGVQERTIYRHYANRAALYEAFWAWVHDRLGQITASNLSELLSQTRSVMTNFDANEALIREMIRNPEGQSIRQTANDWRTKMFLSIVAQEAPELDAAELRRTAALVGLMFSAPTWQMLRDYWDMEGAEAGDTAALGIQLIIEAAKARAKTAQSASKPRKTTAKEK